MTTHVFVNIASFSDDGLCTVTGWVVPREHAELIRRMLGEPATEQIATPDAFRDLLGATLAHDGIVSVAS